MVGESYIFMTSLQKARTLIEAGEIGKPQQIRQRFGSRVERPGVLETGRPVTDDHRGWRMDSKKAGVRASLGCLIIAFISLQQLNT